MENLEPTHSRETLRSEKHLNEISVLLVEDEDYLRDRLARILQRRIGKLYTAENGKKGLELFREIQPDIVITDIRMPLMDGLEMSQEIKKIRDDVPIVITTAHNDEEFFLRAIDIGIDKYIKKPVNRNDLLRVLMDVARTILQQKEIESKNRFIRMILDNSPDFVIICDGNRINYLNDPFLKFLGCRSFEDFSEKYGNLSQFVVSDLDTTPIENDLCEFVHSLPEVTHGDFLIKLKSSLEDDGKDARTYLIHINNLPGYSETLISLSDVTEIEKQKKHYQELSIRDPLTGIYNRKKFNEELEREVDRAQRYDRPLTLIMFDIDFFKKVNDTYGHQRGDQVLIEVTNIVSLNVRKTDLLARYGGEEFLIIAPETTMEKAEEISEKLRALIESHSFEEAGNVTCSFGAADLSRDGNPDLLLKHTDEALYEAKKTGRNRVCLHRTTDPTGLRREHV